MRDALDVDAPGSDIGRDEHVDLAGAERPKRLLARALPKITMDSGRREPALVELVRHLLRGALRPTEDHHQLAVLRLQDAREHLHLVHGVRAIDELGGGRNDHAFVWRLGPDVHRVAHVAAGERDHGRRHRRGEQHRLAQLVRTADEVLHVVEEPEVEHLVRLVEHEHLDVGEIEVSLVGEVEQPARSANHHVDSRTQGVDLRLVGATAVHREHPGAARLAGEREVAGDLDRQLAGRRDHECLRLARLDEQLEVTITRDGDPLQERDAEREGLPGAGARLPDEVVAE